MHFTTDDNAVRLPSQSVHLLKADLVNLVIALCVCVYVCVCVCVCVKEGERDRACIMCTLKSIILRHNSNLIKWMHMHIRSTRR